METERPTIRIDLLTLEAMQEKAEKWAEEKSITPWAIIIGVLTAWLALGTVCMIYVAGVFLK